MQMSRWQRTGSILVLALIVAVIYWPSARVLGEQWVDFKDLAYTHGWLIFAVCVWLVIRDRQSIDRADARPSALAFVALAGCILCWLVAYRASIQDLHITIFPAIFWFAAAAAFGWPVARLLLFPVALLYCAVPSGAQLSGPLQALTVAAMQVVLRLTGPQALISEDLIHIPNGTFEIQEGCSGLHFLTVGLAVAALHGELRRDKWNIRIAQLCLMGALALLANWVRVYTVIEAGYLTDMHSSLLRNHYWFGWGVFGVALFAFFKLSACFEPAASASAFQSTWQPPRARPTMRADLLGLSLATLVLAGVPATSATIRMMRPAAALKMTADPGAPWVAGLVDIHSSWQPRFNGADLEQRLAFTDGSGAAVELFSVSYRTLRQGAKLAGMGTSLIGDGLQLGPEQTMTAPTGEFRESEVAERTPPHNLYLIWSRYETAGRIHTSAFPAQLWYGLKALISNPRASLVALRAACRPDCESARRTLGEFAAAAPRL